MVRTFCIVMIAVIGLAACTAADPAKVRLPANPQAIADHDILEDARRVTLDPFQSVQLARAADAREGARFIAGSGLMVTEAVYAAFDKYTHMAPVPPQPLGDDDALQAARTYGAGYLVQVNLIDWQDEITPIVARREFRKFRLTLYRASGGRALFDEVILIADRGDPERFEADLARALAQITKELYE